MFRSSAASVLLFCAVLPVYAAPDPLPPVLECPKVMVHHPDAAAHIGWSIYSNDPLRLSGADLLFIVDGHLEAILDPDETRALNDESESEVSVFRVSKHRAEGPFTLICHYGDHAQLARKLPDQVNECTVVRRKYFFEEGQVDVRCL